MGEPISTTSAILWMLGGAGAGGGIGAWLDPFGMSERWDKAFSDCELNIGEYAQRGEAFVAWAFLKDKKDFDRINKYNIEEEQAISNKLKLSTGCDKEIEAIARGTFIWDIDLASSTNKCKRIAYEASAKYWDGQIKRLERFAQCWFGMTEDTKCSTGPLFSLMMSWKTTDDTIKNDNTIKNRPYKFSGGWSYEATHDLAIALYNKEAHGQIEEVYKYFYDRYFTSNMRYHVTKWYEYKEKAETIIYMEPIEVKVKKKVEPSVDVQTPVIDTTVKKKVEPLIDTTVKKKAKPKTTKPQEKQPHLPPSDQQPPKIKIKCTWEDALTGKCN